VPLLQPVEERTAEIADGVALGLLADAVDEHDADADGVTGLRDEVLLDGLAFLHQATLAPRWYTAHTRHSARGSESGSPCTSTRSAG
jgi:hypothetical protein